LQSPYPAHQRRASSGMNADHNRPFTTNREEPA
ncbi:hypothetical protein ACUXPJ_002289, partial [Micrococcus luteus]